MIHKFDKSKFHLSVFLDLSRAFDTLDHSILLQKLKCYEADGPALDWFHSYLCNRTQYVRTDDSFSSPLPIKTDVPQGSILGPLLLILYVNDICSVAFIHSSTLMTPHLSALFVSLTLLPGTMMTNQQSGRSPKIVALFSATNFSSYIIELLQLQDAIQIQ